MLFFVEIGLPLAEGKCSSSFDCRNSTFTKVCCYGSCFGNSCVGKFCLTDGDCGGPREYCTSNNECRHFLLCSSNFNCSLSTYCCKRGNLSNVCRSSCVGEKCFRDDDCGGPKELCDMNTAKCKNIDHTPSEDALPRWVVPVVVVCVTLLVLLAGGVAMRRFCLQECSLACLEHCLNDD